jgi:hypothetical protein
MYYAQKVTNVVMEGHYFECQEIWVSVMTSQVVPPNPSGLLFP